MMVRVSLLLLLTGALAAAGCPEPAARFNEFDRRIIDAGTPIPQDGPQTQVDSPQAQVDSPPLQYIPNVTGRFLLTVSPFDSAVYSFQYISENALTGKGDGTATLNMKFTALAVADRTLVGSQTVVNDIAVNAAGEFSFPVHIVKQPGASNPVTGQDVSIDATLQGSIRSEDRLCGVLPQGTAVTASGSVPLAGSTWSAIRVPNDAIGAALPPPELKCPPVELPDAAPLDAALPDAALPDADLPDAVPPDAAPADAAPSDATP